MNITKDIIADLFPLYLEKECSSDTRALVEEYSQRNPQDAQDLHRIATTSLPGGAPAAKNLDEMRSLREARRRRAPPFVGARLRNLFLARPVLGPVHRR